MVPQRKTRVPQPGGALGVEQALKTAIGDHGGLLAQTRTWTGPCWRPGWKQCFCQPQPWWAFPAVASPRLFLVPDRQVARDYHCHMCRD